MVLSKSKQAYKIIGSQGLKEIAHDYKVCDDIDFAKKHSDKSEFILDLGCGYGRVSLALAQAGFENIFGIDIAPNLIRDAKKEANDRGLKIAFKVGDMRKLPYPNGMFGKIFCLWNSFNEILDEEGHLEVLKEALRTLKPEGEAFFVLFNGEDKNIRTMFMDGSLNIANPVLGLNFKGGDIYHFIHTIESLERLTSKISYVRRSISMVDMHKRKRILLHLAKD